MSKSEQLMDQILSMVSSEAAKKALQALLDVIVREVPQTATTLLLLVRESLELKLAQNSLVNLALYKEQIDSNTSMALTIFHTLVSALITSWSSLQPQWQNHDSTTDISLANDVLQSAGAGGNLTLPKEVLSFLRKIAETESYSSAIIFPKIVNALLGPQFDLVQTDEGVKPRTETLPGLEVEVRNAMLLWPQYSNNDTLTPAANQTQGENMTPSSAAFTAIQSLTLEVLAPLFEKANDHFEVYRQLQDLKITRPDLNTKTNRSLQEKETAIRNTLSTALMSSNIEIAGLTFNQVLELCYAVGLRYVLKLRETA